MSASPLYFLLASASTLYLTVVTDTFGCSTENSYSGSVRQRVVQLQKSGLHSSLLLLSSAGPSLGRRKAGSAASDGQYRSCALTSRAGFTTDLSGGSCCVSFYYETSQDWWDLFSSSVLYIACLRTRIVLGVVFAYECLTIYLMYG